MDEYGLFWKVTAWFTSLSDTTMVILIAAAILAIVGVFKMIEMVDSSDGDDNVGFADLNALLNEWGASTPVADLDCNGAVGFADLNALLNAWGPCP